MPRLRSFLIVSSTVATALLALTLPASAATASPGPLAARASEAAAPAVGGSNDFFNSDSCTSSTFCMAVGDYNLNGHTPALAEVLSRGRWVAKPVPSPSRGVNIFANEVSCASPASCLFVGDHFAGQHGSASNLAETWNGSAWRIVTATGPAGTAASALFDVVCPTTRFCLAVGFAGAQDAAYTWTNGTTWRRITVPHPFHARNSELGALACFNSSNCMAAGNYTSASGQNTPFAARWHDSRWAILAMPSVRGQRFTTPSGISCPGTTRCVAVGNTTDKTTPVGIPHAFAEVWNGGKWQVSTLRQPASTFVGVSCPARTRCFAAGETFPSLRSFGHPLIEAWNGRAWTTQHPVQTFAPHNGDALTHVSCVGRSHCEAVGLRFEPGVANSDSTLAELWNGRRWTVQSTPNP